MVLKLPNENWLRERATYTEIFAATLVWNVGVVGLIVFAIFIILLVIKIYQIKKFNNGGIHGTYENYEQLPNKQSKESKQNKQPTETSFKVINFLTSIFFYCLLVCISLVYLSFYIFGFMGVGVGFDILAVICMFMIVLVPTLIWKYITKSTQKNQFRSQIIFTSLMLLIWLVLCIIGVIFLKGGCLCLFNQYYGVTLNQQFQLSTQFSRKQKLNTICLDGKICHLYATLPENASTSVFINAHSGINLNNLTFTLKNSNQVSLNLQSSNPISLIHLQKIGKRNVHSVLFQNLNESTSYELLVTDSNKNILMTSNYRTPPGPNAKQLKLAMGGDVGLNTNSTKLTSFLTKYDPDVIIIGGDIAYDNGMQTCFYSWDNFYWIFEQLFITINRTIPMILTIGNHEVGYDALVPKQIKKSLNDIPLFFIYNPQHVGNSINGVPQFNNRKTNHYHLIGNTMHAILDSGYIRSFQEQVEFIKIVGKKFKSYHKFSNYHNPIYPSCADWSSNSNDMKVYEKGFKFWTPYFDDYEFIASFEHHNHHRKFTKKIKNGKAVSDSQKGVRYVGDGSWGVPPDNCLPSRVVSGDRKDLLVNFDQSNSNHIWQVTLINNGKLNTINYTSINMDGVKVFEAVDILPNIS